MSRFLLYDYSSKYQIDDRCEDISNSRITVFGDKGIGKTSLILRFLNYTNVDLSNSEEDIYKGKLLLKQLLNYVKENKQNETAEIVKENKNLINYLIKRKYLNIMNLQILDADSTIDNKDSAGGFELNEIKALQIRQSDAFLLCYDCSDLGSLLNLREYYYTILDCFDEDTENMPPVLFIGLKSDSVYSNINYNDDVLPFFEDLNVDLNCVISVSTIADHYETYKEYLMRIVMSIINSKVQRKIKLNHSNKLDGNSTVPTNNSISIKGNDFINPNVTIQIREESKTPKKEEKKLHNTSSNISSVDTGNQEWNEKDSLKNKRNRTINKDHNINTKNIKQNTCCVIC